MNSKEIENIYENKNNKINKLEEIKLENVTLKYGNKEIFKNLNLEIREIKLHQLSVRVG